jgi:alpha-glucuronidase
MAVNTEAIDPSLDISKEIAMTAPHPMWLNDTTPLRGSSIHIVGDHPLLQSVRRDAEILGLRLVDDAQNATADIILAPCDQSERFGLTASSDGLSDEGFDVWSGTEQTVALYGGGPGALYAWFQLLRDAAAAVTPQRVAFRFEPERELRMLNHWDNVAVHPVMGQVERGYAGGSLFYDDGSLRDDLTRVDRYARLLASVGINHVSLNNVNVHEREARLLTDDLDTVVRLADVFRPWGVRVHLSVSFASPITVGGLATSDPLEPEVQQWWATAVDRVYDAVPDFGGFVVKADSEGQPGPFAYGRDHADGANMLAQTLAPHGGLVHWRAFVYNHRQDWRDRKTDRARAAFDHFAPLDGRFDDNVILQVKFGPMDFQTREPVSPVIPAMRHTRVALELQVTQEYTGHQLHAVYLAPQWREILDFRPMGDGGPRIADLARGGIAAVANVGDDDFWTGHPLAQTNLYAYGRLTWDSTLDPLGILDEWIALTLGDDDTVRDGIHAILDDSWETYESYTAPLGVCFMVSPHSHYGPSVDGYEYSPWGTYHFADRDGIGVDRTVATGTGYAGQYPEPWSSTYEALAETPDELVLFFHHVPYRHRLRSGSTVIQHIYDSHFAGVERVVEMRRAWSGLEGRVDAATFDRVGERLDEQLRSAIEWRDQINTYFLRKSGIADERGREIY